jgi:hypothetical protein
MRKLHRHKKTLLQYCWPCVCCGRCLAMDLHVTIWYLNLENTFIPRHILQQYWYRCPIALPLHRNPQHRSAFTVVSATSAPSFQPLHHQRNVFRPVVNCFMRQTLPTVNRKHFFMSTFCIESFCSQKTYNRTLLFVRTLLKHGSHFDYWNQPLNTRIRVCYLNCHEARLCCYPVICIENLLPPLQLFYFHLWPIYWPSLVLHPTLLEIIGGGSHKDAQWGYSATWLSFESCTPQVECFHLTKLLMCGQLASLSPVWHTPVARHAHELHDTESVLTLSCHLLTKWAHEGWYGVHPSAENVGRMSDEFRKSVFIKCF